MGARRRTHGKSRHGCQTCKTRHVKCDELRPRCVNCSVLSKECTYLDAGSPDSDDLSDFVLPMDDPDLPGVKFGPDERQEITDRVHQCLEPHGTTSLWPSIDAKLYHVGTQMVNAMRRNEGYTLTVGTAELPNLQLLGYFVGHVRYALLALQTGYYAKERKSLQLEALHCLYKTNALSLLRDAIDDFSRENSDGVLAASLLLWFGSENQQEEESYMQGTALVIQKMQPWKHNSLLQTYVQENLMEYVYNPPQRPSNCDPDVVYEPVLFPLLLEAVRKLHNYIRNSGEDLNEEVKIIYNALRNLRAGGHTPCELMKVRSTLRLYRTLKKETFANIGAGNPQLLVVVAYFELMQAYLMAQRHETVVGFFGAHMRTIERIAGVLEKQYDDMVKARREGKRVDMTDLSKCIELLELPANVAKEYKTRGRYVFVH